MNLKNIIRSARDQKQVDVARFKTVPLFVD